MIFFSWLRDGCDRALYSLIQFTTISLLYTFAQSLGDFQVGFYLGVVICFADLVWLQFLYIDLFLIIPLAVFSKSILFC